MVLLKHRLVLLSEDDSLPKMAHTSSDDESVGKEYVEGLPGRFDGEHMLVPILTPEVPILTDQIAVATIIARATGASLSLYNPISVPEQTPKVFRNQVTDSDDEEILEWALDQTPDSNGDARSGMLFTRDVVGRILRLIRSRDVDSLVLPGKTKSGFLRRSIAERMASAAECDVITVNGESGYESVASILLPVAGGAHTGLAADVAQHIAADTDAWVDILQVVEQDASEDELSRAQELVDDVYHRIARPETTTTWVLESEDVAESIVEQSQYYGLTVIGAPTKGRLRQFIYGSKNRKIRAAAESVVISARNYSATDD